MNERTTMHDNWLRTFFGIAVFAILAMTLATVWDQQVTAFLAEHRWSAFTKIMGRTIFDGELPGANDPLILVLLAAILVYTLSWRNAGQNKWLKYRPHSGFILVAALAIAVLMTNGIKLSMGRARPDLVFEHHWPFSAWFAFGSHFIGNGPYRGSFPSGHTSQAFAAMAVSYVLIANPWFNAKVRFLGWAWGGFAIFASIAMGVARCMSSSHWLTDVVGAVCFGWLIMHWLYHWLFFVPEQRNYIVAQGKFPPLPRKWELQIGGLMAIGTLGLFFFINGIRAVILHNTLWLAAFAPAGAWLIYWTVKKIVHIRQTVRHKLALP
jgi:membrane-associated phospholipid phosphatase